MALDKVQSTHPKQAALFTEVQGYQLDYFAPVTEPGLVMAVTGMAPADTIRAVSQAIITAPVKLPNADFAMHDGRASAHVLFDTVIATDEITVNGTSYIGSDTPTGTQWDSTLATDLLQAGDAVAKINANDATVICEIDGGGLGGFIVRNVATGAVGNAVDITSADGTITVTTNGTDLLDGGNGDAAASTLTCATVIAGNTVTVNGHVYTAQLDSVHDINNPNFFHTGDADVPNDDQCAASLSLAINLREQLNDTVIATVASAVVTVTAANIGVAGNLIALEETGGTVTLSAAVLENGTDLGGGFITVAGGTVPAATTGSIVWIDKK